MARRETKSTRRPQRPFKLISQVHEAETDRGSHLHQDVHIAVFPSVAACPRAEQGQALDRIASAQDCMLFTQSRQDFFTG